jgi:hypothetical protein
MSSMAKRRQDTRPIQVFLDTRRFIEIEEAQPFGGGAKDFFAGNDRGFATHKARINGRVTSVADAMRRSGQPAGFIKVKQREAALAKSHRPLGSLFTEANQFSLVGGEGVGEMLFQATPQALDRLSKIIDTKAEATPRMKENKNTGALEPAVSRYRSEVGGVDDVQLYGATDKVRFSAEEAVAWLRQPNVIGGYIVELFRPNRKVGIGTADGLINRLRNSLQRLGGGLLIRPFLPSEQTTQFGQPSLTLSIQLLDDERRQIELPFLADGRALEMSETGLAEGMRGVRVDTSLARHTELLTVLANQALVRSVELPPLLETAPEGGTARRSAATVAAPAERADYPVVAVIDGGVASNPAIGSWKVGDAGLVPAADRDESHGTFIAGLICAGSSLNPALSETLEPAGCKVYDLDLFPRKELRNAYYPDIEDLFDTLDEKVKVAKRDFGVRVFNLSFRLGTRSGRLAYSLTADRLDRMARANDVVFVVASGNLDALACRPPWPEKAQDALAMLAASAGYDQNITAPADHVLGITVGAVNPPAVPGHIHLMPTTYTRRGPGVGGARKPELVHLGGAGTPATASTGLLSLTTTGEATDNCGSSFAAPLFSATLATLDQRLARVAPRETLLALPIHRAERPTVFERAMLRPVARDFVGFGIPPSADEILHDVPHSVTLLFHDLLLAKQRLEFPFVWPQPLVTAEGACRGKVEVTLSYTPPIDPDHRDEAIRVQLEAYLHQEKLDDETGESKWESRLSHDGSDVAQGTSKSESSLIRSGLKWSPIKRYHASMPSGRGTSSNWKLSLESLVRGGVVFPTEGVSFSLIMTISDLDEEAAVREEMRLSLQNRGFQLADITVAHRVRTRN